MAYSTVLLHQTASNDEDIVFFLTVVTLYIKIILTNIIYCI